MKRILLNILSPWHNTILIFNFANLTQVLILKTMIIEKLQRQGHFLSRKSLVEKNRKTSLDQLHLINFANSPEWSKFATSPEIPSNHKGFWRCKFSANPKKDLNYQYLCLNSFLFFY